MCYILIYCRLEHFHPKCSATETDVFNQLAAEEEISEDLTASESNCSVQIVHLKSDVLETEALNLLAEGTFVDTLLTALPVCVPFKDFFILWSRQASSYHANCCFKLFFFLVFCVLNLPPLFHFIGFVRGRAEYHSCNSSSSRRIVWLVRYKLWLRILGWVRANDCWHYKLKISKSTFWECRNFALLLSEENQNQRTDYAFAGKISFYFRMLSDGKLIRF